jgi:exonuclease III
MARSGSAWPRWHGVALLAARLPAGRNQALPARRSFDTQARYVEAAVNGC